MIVTDVSLVGKAAEYRRGALAGRSSA
jgi:hypothetical protein